MMGRQLQRMATRLVAAKEWRAERATAAPPAEAQRVWMSGLRIETAF